MPKTVAILSDAMSLPLELAGVAVRRSSDPKEAEAIIEECIKDETEVLIIQDKLRDGFSEWFRNRIARHRGKPLLVYCPSFEEEKSNVDAYLAAVLKPAIGYEIRLE